MTAICYTATSRTRGSLLLQCHQSGARPTKPRPPQQPFPMDPVERTRKQLGYKNKWSRRPVDESHQVTWRDPLKQSPSVAIIGGGLSGLCCGQELARLGIRSTIFDTGEHGVGGRLATRTTKDRSIRRAWMQDPDYEDSNLMWDHAAQFFTVTDPRFNALVQQWEAAGAVKEWTGPMGTLKPGGAFTAMPLEPARYVATRGMRGLAKFLGESLEKQHGDLVEIKRPLWVSSMKAEDNLGWKIMGRDKSQGIYDVVVIAHNGKCANRLVGPTGAPLVAKQLMSLRLSAVWVAMVAFNKPVPCKFEGAFIEGNEVLSWAANNTAKLGLRHMPHGLQCWTLISTSKYGAEHKVPQEAIPEEVQDMISTQMIEAFAKVIGMQPGALPPVVFRRCQLWGAALPTNTLGVECILDPNARVGACGDWLLGGSMQAAAVSGISLAQQIAGLRGKGMQQREAFKQGLTAPFQRLKGSDIGEFPA